MPQVPLLNKSLPCEYKVLSLWMAMPGLHQSLFSVQQSMLAPVTWLLANKNDPAPQGARLHPPDVVYP